MSDTHDPTKIHSANWMKRPKPITSFGQPIPLSESAGQDIKDRNAQAAHQPDDAGHVADTKHFKMPYQWFENNVWKYVTDDIRLYVLIDGEHCIGAYGRLLNSTLDWTHLFQGEAALNNVQGGPFLVALEKGDAFFQWLVEEGWGQGWGTYFLASTAKAKHLYQPSEGNGGIAPKTHDAFVRLQAHSVEDNAPLILLRRHFRRYTRVEFEDDGRIVQFRFYDPAVLKAYLLSCNLQELSRFFGPVTHYFCEGYCEVESLNRPQDFYGFVLQDKADGSRQLISQCSNLTDGIEVRLPQFAAANEKISRQTGPFITIRAKQREIFQFVQTNLFIEKVAITLRNLALSYNQTISHEAAQEFVSQQLERGRALRLSTEEEILAFALCALVYGEGFENNLVQANDILKPDENGCPRWDVTEQLMQFAKTGLEKVLPNHVR